MRRGYVALALLVVTVLATGGSVGGCGGRTAVPYGQGAERYRFTFRLEKVRGETGACTGIMAVRDLAADRTIAIPMFTAPWGATATAAAADAAYGARFEVTATVNAAGTSGEVRGVLRRGTELVASHTATVPVAIAKNNPDIDIR